MADTKTTRPTCSWKGSSGAIYGFYIYALPASFDPGQPGNYVYAKKNAEGRWVPVYIGEGDLGERSGPGHHQSACIRRHGATHFHCHLNADQRARRAEEADLLARYTNAFEPTGCNQRPTG